MVDYSPAGRLAKLVVRGTYFRGDAAAAVRSASITLDSREVATLNLSVADPYLSIAATRLFDPGGLIAYLDLVFRIQSCEVVSDTGTPHLSVVARSEKVQALRRQKGARVWKNRSPSQVATELAKSVGYAAHIQPSAARRSIARGATESSWGLITRLADELKWMLFESVNGIFFGTLAALVALPGAIRRPVVWDRTTQKGTGELADVPQCRKSEDSTYAAEMSFAVVGPAADQWRLGDVAVLDGVPGFTGDYLVTHVDIPLTDGPVSVQARAAKLTSMNTAAPGRLATSARFAALAARQCTPTTAVLPEASTYDASELVYWALSQLGVKFVRGSDAQLAYSRNRGTSRTVAKAMTVRGALLFNGRRVAVSLGDGRVIEATGTTFVAVSRPAETWTAAALVPGLAYPGGS